CVRLAEQLTIQPLTDTRLQEYDFGEWEMMLWDEIRGPAAAQWFADYVHTPAPQGESYVQMAERVVAFWEEILMSEEAPPERPLVVVTHAGVIRALLAHLLQMPLRQAFNLTIDLGGVTQLTVRETHIQVDYINR
ncbi:MAG: histidine phosphatase family protein, partial [Anaerolineales bacterium]|nr:histidine phosphatase family protein [Anaerolineales bacterium]